MITYLVVIAFILTTSYNLSRLSKKNIELLIPFSLFLAIIWTTLAGIIGHMVLGVVLLVAINILLALYFLIKKNDLSIKLLQEFLKPSISFLILASLWTFIHSQRMQFFEWDEFTHWGPAVKSMFLFDVLGPSSPVVLNNAWYPPGLSILAYLIVKIGGIWDEADVFWAYQLLYISLLIPILSKFTFRKTGYFLFSSLILILSSLYFYNVFQTIYADALLSLIFGFTLYLASQQDTVRDKWSFSFFLLSLSALILTKDFGIILALASIAVLMVNAATSLGVTKGNSRIRFIKASIYGLISTTSILGTRFIWTTYASAGNLSSGVEGAVASSPTFLRRISQVDEEFLRQLRLQLFEYIKHEPLSLRGGVAISALWWTVIIFFLLVAFVLSASSKAERIRSSAISLTAFTGFFGFFVAIFFVYLNFYGLAMTDYVRYVSSFFSGMVFYLGALAVDAIKKFSANDLLNDKYDLGLQAKKFPLYVALFTSLIIIVSPTGFALNYYYTPNQHSDAVRNNFAAIKSKVELAEFTVDDRVGIIAQHTMGFEYYVLQYEVMPASVYKTGNYTWSIGSPSGPADVWTNQLMTPENWNSYLANINYLIVNNVSQSFIEEFGFYFDETESFTKEPMIYRIVNEGSNYRLVKYI